MELRKHKTIVAFLARLAAEIDPGSWTIVDHWDADLTAIGIARRDDPGVLVYVSTWLQPPGRYTCALELPPAPGDDHPYRPAGEEGGVELSEVLRLVRAHLSIGSPG